MAPNTHPYRQRPRGLPLLFRLRVPPLAPEEPEPELKEAASMGAGELWAINPPPRKDAVQYTCAVASLGAAAVRLWNLNLVPWTDCNSNVTG